MKPSGFPLEFLNFFFCLVVWSESYLKPVLYISLNLLEDEAFLKKHKVYSANKLNKQGDNTALFYSFPNFEPISCSMSSSNCSFLTCIQVSQETGKVVQYSPFFKKEFSTVCCDPHRTFSIVNEWEIDVFLEFSCFLYVPSKCWQFDFSAFSKPSLYIWKFLVHVLLKPSLKDLKHCFASMRNDHNCMVVWTFFGTALLWDWNEKWPFPVLWPLLNFPNMLLYWIQHFNSIIF